MSAPDDVSASPYPPGYWATLFDVALGLPSVNKLLAMRACEGISRYRTRSGDYPALSLTFSWGRTGVWVERVLARIEFSAMPRQHGPAETRSAWVPRYLLPWRLRRWPVALLTFAAAPSVDCSDCGMDGFAAHHSWAGPDGSGEADWFWPEGHDRGQWRLIWAYRRLQLLAWLLSSRHAPADVALLRIRRVKTP